MTKLKRIVLSLIDGHPRLLFPALRLFTGGKYARSIVDAQTELVISGYPRSANSFASMAVYISHPNIAMTSHLHAAAEVVEAVRLGIPTVVLIRRPEDAIRSLKGAIPETDENSELKRWLRYYSRIEGLHDRFIISPFEQTITDFGSVIDAVNARFGTAFARFEPTAENRARVFERLEQSVERFSAHRFAGNPADREARLGDVELAFDPVLLAQATRLLARFEELSGWQG